MLKGFITDLGLDVLAWDDTIDESGRPILNLPDDATEGTAELANSDEYGKYYSLLADNPMLEPVEDLDDLNLFGSSFTWKCHYEDESLYTITLRADFENDKYEVEITKEDSSPDEETRKE